MPQAEKTARKLETLIFEVAALQKDCVEMVCAHCKSPCCERVGYLFGEKDVLFLKLSGRKQVWRKNGIRKKGCGLLGPLGCTLGWGQGLLSAITIFAMIWKRRCEVQSQDFFRCCTKNLKPLICCGAECGRSILMIP